MAIRTPLLKFRIYSIKETESLIFFPLKKINIQHTTIWMTWRNYNNDIGLKYKGIFELIGNITKGGSDKFHFLVPALVCIGRLMQQKQEREITEPAWC